MRLKINISEISRDVTITSSIWWSFWFLSSIQNLGSFVTPPRRRYPLWLPPIFSSILCILRPIPNLQFLWDIMQAVMCLPSNHPQNLLLEKSKSRILRKISSIHLNNNLLPSYPSLVTYISAPFSGIFEFENRPTTRLIICKILWKQIRFHQDLDYTFKNHPKFPCSP